MTGIEQFFIHTVSVETYQGRTPTGESYASPQDVRGFMDQGLVTKQNGDGSISLVDQSIFYTSLDQKAMLTPQSRITYAGDVSIVKATKLRDGGDGPLGRLSHLQVDLQ